MSVQERYHKVAIGLHWLIAFLIISQIAVGFFMHKLPATSFKFELYQWHKSFGMLILFLSVARLGWRLGHKPPALPDEMKPWEKSVSKITHGAFYVLMIGAPLVGWAMVSASPLEVDTVLFKFIPWPHLPGIPVSEANEDFLKEIHELLAKGIIALLVLHVGAALKHHFVERDTILTRMIPGLKQRTS